MFEFIGREKRIRSKSKYIGEHFEQESKHGKKNFDTRIVLAEKMAVAPNPKALEQIMDDFIAVMHRVTVDTLEAAQQIPVQNVHQMELAPDISGEPVMQVQCWDGVNPTYFEFPLTTGFEVNRSNEFLRSLDLGVDICFETFCQYAQLIWECSDLLKEKQVAV